MGVFVLVVLDMCSHSIEDMGADGRGQTLKHAGAHARMPARTHACGGACLHTPALTGTRKFTHTGPHTHALAPSPIRTRMGTRIPEAFQIQTLASNDNINAEIKARRHNQCQMSRFKAQITSLQYPRAAFNAKCHLASTNMLWALG
jgi:hypothetical protein